MRQRRPESKYSMQYDKLIIDHEIYMFNDMTGRVEEVSQSIQNLDYTSDQSELMSNVGWILV